MMVVEVEVVVVEEVVIEGVVVMVGVVDDELIQLHVSSPK